METLSLFQSNLYRSLLRFATHVHLLLIPIFSPKLRIVFQLETKTNGTNELCMGHRDLP